MKPLPVPQPVINDENSVQMISAWIAERGLHCSLNIGMWHAMGVNEPMAWGKFLADAIRHIADAHHKEFGSRHEDVIAAIQSCLLDELGDPTTEVEGDFHKGGH